MDAVRRGDAAAVRALIQRKAPVGLAEADGTTALHLAVQADRLDIVQALLKAGAPANAATRYGITPLALAATNGNPAVVGALLEGGANANAANPEGETVLMAAARSGSVAVVDRLLAVGADVNARDSWRGETAVMRAAGENQRRRLGPLCPQAAIRPQQSRDVLAPFGAAETEDRAAGLPGPASRPVRRPRCC